jgi:hypothetical protein
MKIKKLNEQFAQTFSGDGFNSSNGVFKVKYKAFDDLSQAKGREIHPYDQVKGEEFQVGDLVSVNTGGKSKKKMKAEVISASRTEDGKSMKFKVRSLHTNKIYTVPVYAIEFLQDNGNSIRKEKNGATIANKEKWLMSLKYNNGNFIWGSLESKNTNMKTDMLLKEGDSAMERPSIIDPSINVALIDDTHPDYTTHIENFKKLGSIYTIPENKTIYIHKKDPSFSRFNDNHLVVIEAVEIAKMLSGRKNNIDEEYNDVLAAQILRNKGLKEAYKIIASNFLKKHGISYGEAADEFVPSMKQYLPERKQ